MILRLNQPSDDEVRAVLDGLLDAPFTYEPVGHCENDLSEPPPGFRLDHHGVELGHGRATFESAVESLASGSHYPSPFTRLVRRTESLESGQLFAAVARHFGFFSIHPCRVLFVLREENRFGYGFGTLPGHAEAGEERFTITLKDGVVRYDIQAFSRPCGLLSRLASPVGRQFQKRFFRESLDTLRSSLRATGDC